MSKKIVWQWEKIDPNTKRVKAMGGWLIHHTQSKSSECMWFLPDQDHQWEPIEPYVEPEVKRSILAEDFKAK